MAVLRRATVTRNVLEDRQHPVVQQAPLLRNGQSSATFSAVSPYARSPMTLFCTRQPAHRQSEGNRRRSQRQRGQQPSDRPRDKPLSCLSRNLTIVAVTGRAPGGYAGQCGGPSRWTRPALLVDEHGALRRSTSRTELVSCSLALGLDIARKQIMPHTARTATHARQQITLYRQHLK